MSSESQQSSRTRLIQLITEELTRSMKSEEDAGGMKLIGLNIQSIPPEAIELIRGNVERLSLQKNNISMLPQYFNRLSKLRYLDIHDNRFTTFPEILTTMTELEILDISFNNLRSLPNDLGHLKNLKVLSLKNNNFEVLPTSLLSITNLKILEVENNPLKIPSQSFINNIPHKPQSPEWLYEIKTFLHHNKELIETNIPAYDISQQLQDNVSTTTPIKETEKPPLSSHLSSQSQSTTSSATSSTTSLPHLERSRSTSESYVSSRAAKRMGFIVKRPNIESSSSDLKESHEENPSSSNDPWRNRSMSTTTAIPPNSNIIEEEDEIQDLKDSNRLRNGGTNSNASPIHSDKLNSIPEHKSRDYFKRLSTLPEQRPNISQFKIVDISRKILFAITEFQSTIKKLNVFCSDKNIVIEMVSQLYHSKSIIDHLVENLEKTEENNDGYVSIDDILQSVNQTVSIFKKMIDLLQGNIHSYVKNADVCFVRMLLLSLFLSYGEVFNAYKILRPSTQSNQRNPKDIYSNNHNNTTTNNNTRSGVSQLPPLKVNDLSNSVAITQQQLNEYNEADQKLYESLHTVLESSSQVYAELNDAISKGAIANATKPAEDQQQSLNPTTIPKIKDLTNTCVVSMDLNRKIKSKLISNSIKNGSLLDKKKFFDEINALLKSIITILGSTKSIMNEMPILNGVRPSLASLTKATKDVTIMLEVSSYRLINDSFSSMNSSIPQSATTYQPTMISSIPSVVSIPQINTPFLPNIPTVHTPLQSAAVTHPNANPFEATLANNLQHDDNSRNE
ncbi:Leucine-rich repeat-containing protein sog2 [Wickerhamomyces ciferrii]|uniref:Leucine-rich repeat-containing protein sog2 n=1 Tax=Wickerhamomyces ciferrii (strain ATCC 14091 / BCRC 22168 / CBS 111 / JCM 3599 / NBRC 0793 / NRRL Y-1031 F-60-10) TaxID=1206466 RepID=K0KG39_WICCF|nr:Leucine-rich repeat-containing protein sog2 [Wickerhamomyces ciferrii]CCH44120.1 Leucine-rich repeat-containing protein sog2 [Wickerhamomyces ciferrii]